MDRCRAILHLSILLAIIISSTEACPAHGPPGRHFGNGGLWHKWKDTSSNCPMESPCTCNLMDVPVQLTRSFGPPWKRNITTYKHRVNCSNQHLQTNNLPAINITHQTEDFVLFDFSANQIQDFPATYFKNSPGLLFLNLSQNHFTTVPTSVSNLNTLGTLSFNHNPRFDLGEESTFEKMELLNTLLLAHSGINHLRATALKGLKSLKILHVNHNSIILIEEGIFKSTPMIAELKMNSNKLTIINSAILEGLRNLRMFDLSDNKIEEIPSNCFRNSPNLENLYIARNQIKVLDGNSFYNMLKLETLDMRHNFVESIPRGMFDSMDSLKTLHLSRNNLKTMKYEQWKGIPMAMKTLNLASNELSITSFDTMVFSLFPNLLVLSLSNNPLQLIPNISSLGLLTGISLAHTQVAHIYPCDLKGLTNIKTFLWTGSPIACDCQNKWFRDWFEDNVDYNNRRNVEEELIWICQTPEKYKGKLFHELDTEDFDCVPQGHGISKQCHAFNGSGVVAIPKTTAKPIHSTTVKNINEDEDDYNSNIDDDTIPLMDYEDMQDMHDLNVLLGRDEILPQKSSTDNTNGGHSGIGSSQIILMSSFSCILIIGAVIISALYIRRKKKRFTRRRTLLQNDIVHLNAQASEPPPYVTPQATDNIWYHPPALAGAYDTYPPAEMPPQYTSGGSKPHLPQGEFSNGGQASLADGTVCTDNSSLPNKQ